MVVCVPLAPVGRELPWVFARGEKDRESWGVDRRCQGGISTMGLVLAGEGWPWGRWAGKGRWDSVWVLGWDEDWREGLGPWGQDAGD